MTLAAKAMSYEETPVKAVSAKSARKIVKENSEKTLQNISVSKFLWVKVKQHRNGLILALFIAENAYFVYHFVAYGVK